MKKQSKSTTYNPAIASVIIRVGLAAVFMYAAVDAFRNPNAWISFIPAFSEKFIAAKTSLDIISVFQIGVAIWLVTGKYLTYAALASIGLLAGIMVFNPETFLITFRDIGLIAAAAALIFLDD